VSARTHSSLTLIAVPFHLGFRDVGMGAGPLELLAGGGVPDALVGAGYDLEVVSLENPSGTHEIGRVFELNRALARTVTSARAGGRLPVVLGGNCNVCLGAIGGVGDRRAGIVWVDAHPDFHTPETTNSGFLDGMSLAAATGGCWSTLSRSIPGFDPIEERNAVLVGVRSIDPLEQRRLATSEVTVIAGGAGPGSLALEELERAVEAVAGRVEGIYLHLDFDSIDPSLGRANEYAAEGGLDVGEIRTTISTVIARTPVLAASFTAYNPAVDPERRFRATAVEVVGAAVEATSAGSPDRAR